LLIEGLPIEGLPFDGSGRALFYARVRARKACRLTGLTLFPKNRNSKKQKLDMGFCFAK
jgi:hypothetical protein